MKASKRDVLTRRFDAIRTKLGDRLHQFVAAKEAGEPGGDGSVLTMVTPTLSCYISAG